MEFKCPHCDEMGGLNKTHRHLIDDHIDLVVMEYDDETDKMRYIISCPFCPLRYQHKVKPRLKNPMFLQEYRSEIALVAFDQLLYHVLKDHGEEVGFNLDELDLEDS